MISDPLDIAWTRIERAAEKWVKVLGIEHLSILHKRLDSADVDDADAVAFTRTTWQYESASIHWHVPKVCCYTDDELDWVMVHELCHVLLDPMEQYVKDVHLKDREFAVTRVAKAVLSAYNAGARGVC
jgi:enoyl reductase-like protein